MGSTFTLVPANALASGNVFHVAESPPYLLCRADPNGIVETVQPDPGRFVATREEDSPGRSARPSPASKKHHLIRHLEERGPVAAATGVRFSTAAAKDPKDCKDLNSSQVPTDPIHHHTGRTGTRIQARRPRAAAGKVETPFRRHTSQYPPKPILNIYPAQSRRRFSKAVNPAGSGSRLPGPPGVRRTRSDPISRRRRRPRAGRVHGGSMTANWSWSYSENRRRPWRLQALRKNSTVFLNRKNG